MPDIHLFAAALSVEMTDGFERLVIWVQNVERISGGKMGQELKIESEEAYQLASKLSELTGETLTAAVTEALRRRLAHEEDVQRRIAEVRKITARMRAAMLEEGPLPTSNHDFLYDDETGLPV
jgi:antitoxin VapB